MKMLWKKQNNFLLTLIVGIFLTGILIALPTGYEDAVIYQDAERAICEVVEVDNSAVITSGLIQSGEQSCILKVTNGMFKGRTIEGVNFLSGSLEKDKMYEAGDRALVTISHSGEEIRSAVMSDHFRLDKETVLLVLFAVLLIAVAGKNGLQAIFSFVISILIIWKILVPCYLRGYSPIWTGILIVVALTLIIIFFVYGWDRRTMVASAGSLLGILTTCVFGILFTDLFKLHVKCRIITVQRIPESGSDRNLHEQHFHRCQWRNDGSVSRYYLCCGRSGTEKARDSEAGSIQVRDECLQGSNGNHDNHTSTGIFWKLCDASYGIYGTGNPDRPCAELPVCSLRSTAYTGRKLWPGNRRAIYSIDGSLIFNQKYNQK